MLSGIDNHLNPLTCIPAGCKGLAVGGHFAPFLGDCTVQSATPQHPGIRCRVIRTSGSVLLEKMDNLHHMTQLRSLKVEAPAAVSGLAGLGNLPRSLTSLCIGRWGEGNLTIVLPELGWSPKAKCLRRLKDLQFHKCSVHICVGSILNLKGLTSLSMHQCGVGSGLDAVSQLTSLVCLDLTLVRNPILSGSEEWQPWRRFEAWPALSVFKFAGCCLIDRSTVLAIASVQEVHTDRLTVGMETANIHWVLQDEHAAVFNTLSSLLVSGWPTHLVALHVTVTDWRDQALPLADVVNQVLGALLCLQSFHLVEGPYNPFHCLGRPNPWEQPVDYRPGQIVLGDGYSGELKDLKLHYLHYHTLDLGVATCLTNISLRNIEQPGVPCELSLPSSVVRLEVFGNG